ncbi:F-box/LRR-repeat protein 6 isoform X2 [Hemicordylus capensis]|uniref:F-box/LRR-repeat protein 6 isoform X2 n=1 Tax=Hemicordylus capensis TaxID=884348 RepID=UPI002303393B|nr:F-box/LRR-repeat protein 6 isoform X2 [Hemicordylus capensis]
MEEPRMDEKPGDRDSSPERPLATMSRASRKRGAVASGSRGAASRAPKKKKKVARKAPRRAAPDYLVHETDNDMLLIISNVGEMRERPARKVPKRKRKPPKGLQKPAASRRQLVKRRTWPERPVTAEVVGGSRKASPASLPPAAGSSWGEHLPLEILVQVFQHVVASEGAVPFLCRVACVCRLWYGAASSPVLWQKVSVGHCWVAPGQRQSPVVEKRVCGTMEWLVANRLSHLRDFTLCHWKNHVSSVLRALGSSCPLLQSLKLSYCSKVTTESLSAIAEGCPQLESLNLQNSQNGCCPGLQLLEVNTEIRQSLGNLQLPIEQLQAACPHLQVLRLLNVLWGPKSSPRSARASLGFPALEELCLATTNFSFVDDRVLQRLLWASRRLRVLDLRGCYHVTPKGLEQLPCPDLEQLYLGLYSSLNSVPLPLQGCALVTWKWHHSLRELDLTGQRFSEQDLEQAMAAFTQGEGEGGEPLLSSLNLAGTKIVLQAVSALIAGCPALRYLNLSSCRHLPRSTKKAYRGAEEIRQCLHQLLTSTEEPAGPVGTT